MYVCIFKVASDGFREHQLGYDFPTSGHVYQSLIFLFRSDSMDVTSFIELPSPPKKFQINCSQFSWEVVRPARMASLDSDDGLPLRHRRRAAARSLVPVATEETKEATKIFNGVSLGTFASFLTCPVITCSNPQSYFFFLCFIWYLINNIISYHFKKFKILCN